MPDLRDNANIIEKSYDVFAKVQRQEGLPLPDESSFVGGFIACFGIITGRVDIGLDQNAPLTTILDNIHKDIASFAEKYVNTQRPAKN
jgi:hypothetical protein